MRIDEIFPGTELGDRMDAFGDKVLDKTSRRLGSWAIKSQAGQYEEVKLIANKMFQDWMKTSAGQQPTYPELADYILKTYGQEPFDELAKVWPQLNPLPTQAPPSQATPSGGTSATTP